MKVSPASTTMPSSSLPFSTSASFPYFTGVWQKFPLALTEEPVSIDLKVADMEGSILLENDGGGYTKHGRSIVSLKGQTGNVGHQTLQVGVGVRDPRKETVIPTPSHSFWQ